MLEASILGERESALSALAYNFHAVLEEYTGHLAPSAAGDDSWPWELFFLSEPSRDELLRNVTRSSARCATELHPCFGIWRTVSAPTPLRAGRPAMQSYPSLHHHLWISARSSSRA